MIFGRVKTANRALVRTLAAAPEVKAFDRSYKWYKTLLDKEGKKQIYPEIYGFEANPEFCNRLLSHINETIEKDNGLKEIYADEEKKAKDDLYKNAEYLLRAVKITSEKSKGMLVLEKAVVAFDKSYRVRIISTILSVGVVFLGLAMEQASLVILGFVSYAGFLASTFFSLPSRWEKALQTYQKALAVSIGTKNVDAYIPDGNAKYDADDFSGALVDYGRAIGIMERVSDLAPENREENSKKLMGAYVNRANTYMKLGQKGKAIKDYSRAIEICEAAIGSNPLLANELALQLGKAYEFRSIAKSGTWFHRRGMTDDMDTAQGYRGNALGMNCP